jgi:serine/threonine-protein kinase
VTTASDVYSLGVLLYHLLSGRSPYASANGPIGAISREICEQVPAPPSAVASGPGAKPIDHDWCSQLRGDLDCIAMLALQKDPSRRYSSVDLLAADVRRYLEDRPVLARGNAVPDRVNKFIRRNRMASAASLAALLAVVAGLLVIQRGEHIRARRSAEQLAAARLTERVLLQQLQVQSGVADAVSGHADTERLLRRLESLAAGTRGEERVRSELLRNGVPPAPPESPPSR